MLKFLDTQIQKQMPEKFDEMVTRGKNTQWFKLSLTTPKVGFRLTVAPRRQKSQGRIKSQNHIKQQSKTSLKEISQVRNAGNK